MLRSLAFGLVAFGLVTHRDRRRVGRLALGLGLRRLLGFMCADRDAGVRATVAKINGVRRRQRMLGTLGTLHLIVVIDVRCGRALVDSMAECGPETPLTLASLMPLSGPS